MKINSKILHILYCFRSMFNELKGNSEVGAVANYKLHILIICQIFGVSCSTDRLNNDYNDGSRDYMSGSHIFMFWADPETKEYCLLSEQKVELGESVWNYLPSVDGSLSGMLRSGYSDGDSIKIVIESKLYKRIKDKLKELWDTPTESAIINYKTNSAESLLVNYIKELERISGFELEYCMLNMGYNLNNELVNLNKGPVTIMVRKARGGMESAIKEFIYRYERNLRIIENEWLDNDKFIDLHFLSHKKKWTPSEWKMVWNNILKHHKLQIDDIAVYDRYGFIVLSFSDPNINDIQATLMSLMRIYDSESVAPDRQGQPLIIDKDNANH